MFTTCTRKFARYLYRGMLTGHYPLRVLGSPKAGYRLCIERGDNLYEVGPDSFPRQKDAVAYGESNYLTTAKAMRPAKVAA